MDYPKFSEEYQYDKTFTYAYDKTGNIISVTDADGRTETYAYDLMDREIRRTAKDGAA